MPKDDKIFKIKFDLVNRIRGFEAVVRDQGGTFTEPREKGVHTLIATEKQLQDIAEQLNKDLATYRLFLLKTEKAIDDFEKQFKDILQKKDPPHDLL